MPHMKIESMTESDLTTAATVAGKDLASGDFVSWLTEIAFFPSFL